VSKALAQEIRGVAGLSDDVEPALGEQSRNCANGALGRSDLCTNARAPALRTSSEVVMSPLTEVSTIRGRHGSVASSRASATPSPSGSSTSIRIAEGSKRPTAASAAATLSASPATVNPLAASSRPASRRNSGSSSTTKTDRDPITAPMIAVSLELRGRETRKCGASHLRSGFLALLQPVGLPLPRPSGPQGRLVWRGHMYGRPST
jgi:hypothetical protein